MAIKADLDTTLAMEKLYTDTTAFAEFLANVNKNWPVELIYNIFTTMEDLYIAQATHRLKKEWADGVLAADTAYNNIVVKQENGDPSFADIFSAGISDAVNLV